MSGGGETYSIIMYWDKDACYTLLPVEKMYSVKDEGLDLEEYMEESGMGQITGNAEDLTLDKAEFVTVKGKECVKETYQLDQSEAAYILTLPPGICCPSAPAWKARRFPAWNSLPSTAPVMKTSW